MLNSSNEIQGDQERVYNMLQGDPCYETEGETDLQSDQLYKEDDQQSDPECTIVRDDSV